MLLHVSTVAIAVTLKMLAAIMTSIADVLLVMTN